MFIQSTVTVFAAVLLFVISGVCQRTFTCKSDIPNLKEDPCLSIVDRVVDSRYNPFRAYFDAFVQIAVKDSDGSYIVKAFGIAVAEKYFLTSVTSNFIKYGSSDLYIIVGGTEVHQIRSKDVQPEITIGVFNMEAWQDLALVKITDDFKFKKVIRINGNTNVELHKTTMIAILVEKDAKNFWTNFYKPYANPADCEKMFEEDRFLIYDRNYMACGLDKGNYKVFSGSPLGQILNEGVGVVLTGIRSHNSLHETNTYLVTQVAPHCGWLKSVSNEAVKCVSNLG